MKNNQKKHKKDNKISRKNAVKKIGMSAFTAGTMLFLLSNPAKAQDPSIPPDWEW
jgi:hypothetical protein